MCGWVISEIDISWEGEGARVCVGVWERQQDRVGVCVRGRSNERGRELVGERERERERWTRERSRESGRERDRERGRERGTERDRERGRERGWTEGRERGREEGERDKITDKNVAEDTPRGKERPIVGSVRVMRLGYVWHTNARLTQLRDDEKTLERWHFMYGVEMIEDRWTMACRAWHCMYGVEVFERQSKDGISCIGYRAMGWLWLVGSLKL